MARPPAPPPGAARRGAGAPAAGPLAGPLAGRRAPGRPRRAPRASGDGPEGVGDEADEEEPVPRFVWGEGAAEQDLVGLWEEEEPELDGLGSDWRTLQRLMEGGQDGPGGGIPEAPLTAAELEAQARGSCDFFLEHAGTSQLPLRTEEDFVPEDSPEVEWHHQRLAEFARQGAGENAREVLLEMMETGLLPGPKAYHAAVYACAAAGDPVGGVSVLRRAVEAGVKPLPQSFFAVLRAFGAALDWGRMSLTVQCMARLCYGKDDWVVPGLREILYAGIAAVAAGRLGIGGFVDDVWEANVFAHFEARATSEEFELWYETVPWIEHLVEDKPMTEFLWRHEPAKLLRHLDIRFQLFDPPLITELGALLSRQSVAVDAGGNGKPLRYSMQDLMRWSPNSVRMHHFQFLVEEALRPQGAAGAQRQMARLPNGTVEAGVDMLRNLLMWYSTFVDFRADSIQLFNTVLHFCLQRNDDAGVLEFQLQELEALRFQHGVLGDQYYHFMYLLGMMRCESFCRQPDLLMEHFYSMVYFSKGRRVTAETSGKRDDCELFLSKERLVPNLLFLLCNQGQAKDILYVLMLVNQERVAPDADIFKVRDEQGLTIVTSWMNTWEELQALKKIETLRLDGVELIEKYELHDYQFDRGGWLVDRETYKVVALSKMRKMELAAELEYRGLSTEGVRDELSKRLRAARLAGPAPLLKEKKAKAAKAPPEHPAVVWDRMHEPRTMEELLNEEYDLRTKRKQREIEGKVVTMWRAWQQLDGHRAKAAEAARLRQVHGAFDNTKARAAMREKLRSKGHDVDYRQVTDEVKGIDRLRTAPQLALKILEYVRKLGGPHTAEDALMIYRKALELKDWKSAAAAARILASQGAERLPGDASGEDLYASFFERCLQSDERVVIVDVLNELEGAEEGAAEEGGGTDARLLRAMRERFAAEIEECRAPVAGAFGKHDDQFWAEAEHPLNYVDWGELRDYGVLEVFAADLFRDPETYGYVFRFGLEHRWAEAGPATPLAKAEDPERSAARVPWEAHPPPWRAELTEAELDGLRGLAALDVFTPKVESGENYQLA